MTVTTGAAAEQSALSEEQRDALVSEMSRLQQLLDKPDAHHCFCGDDRMLVETVHELRERVERELGDDEPEL